jgi:hypothetical protein
MSMNGVEGGIPFFGICFSNSATLCIKLAECFRAWSKWFESCRFSHNHSMTKPEYSPLLPDF